MAAPHSFDKRLAFLERLPAIDLPAGRDSISQGAAADGTWWVKFFLKTDHPLAWRHVQELGHVLNLVSLNEPLPTIFKPVSPPPYLNGGVEFLSWVIASTDPAFTPDHCEEWLEGRMPRPVDDPNEWAIEDDDDDDDEENQ
jgi:hypothetical protein